jgi:hypothetical protein
MSRLAVFVSLLLALARPAWAATPNPHGKVVLFPFRGDDDDVAAEVQRLLRAHGLEVMTGVRPVDSAEQYRDMATQLVLVGYVDGSVRGTGPKAKVTVRLRSGYSGRIVAQPSFGDGRSGPRHDLGDKFWKKLGPAVTRVCKEATMPRKRSRTLLTIDAGTPIETVPREPRDHPVETQTRTASASAPQPRSATKAASTWVDPFAD